MASVIRADNHKGFKLKMEDAETPTRPLYNTLMVLPASQTKKGINHTFDLRYVKGKGSQEEKEGRGGRRRGGERREKKKGRKEGEEGKK